MQVSGAARLTLTPLGSVCSGPLNPKSYKVVNGVIYCFTHTPVDRSTAIDSVANKAAMNAPKKTTEGLGVVQRAPEGSAPKIGLDSVVNRTAMTAPRQGAATQSGVHKGDPAVVSPRAGAPVNASEGGDA